MSIRKTISGIIGGIGLVVGLGIAGYSAYWHYQLSIVRTSLGHAWNTSASDVVQAKALLNYSNYGLAIGGIIALFGLISVVMNYLKKDE